MPTRRTFLAIAATLPVLATAGQGSASAASIRFRSLADARPALDRLQANGSRSAGPITVHQMLHHCAQSLEYGLSGFPELKSAWFRATIGPAAAQVFLWRGALSHDLAEPIPAAPPLPAAGDMAAAFGRLHAAIAAFEAAVAANVQLAPHFAYGVVPPADYARLQAFHIAQHLEAVAPVA